MAAADVSRLRSSPPATAHKMVANAVSSARTLPVTIGTAAGGSSCATWRTARSSKLPSLGEILSEFQRRAVGCTALRTSDRNDELKVVQLRNSNERLLIVVRLHLRNCETPPCGRALTVNGAA